MPGAPRGGRAAGRSAAIPTPPIRRRAKPPRTRRPATSRTRGSTARQRSTRWQRRVPDARNRRSRGRQGRPSHKRTEGARSAGEETRRFSTVDYPLPPPAGGEGEGGGGPTSRFAAAPTSPSRCWATGPSLSPLKGGEGLFFPVCTWLVVRRSARHQPAVEV